MTETAGLARALQRATMRFDPNTLREYVDDTESLWAIREEMTARFPTLHLDVDKARLLGLKVVASRLLGDFELAMSDGKQALELAEATGRDLLIAPARARLARVHAWRQEYEEADRLFAMAEAGELPRGLIASVRLHAGLSCIAQGRLIEALIHLERALDDSSGDEWFTSIAEYALDASHRRAGAYGFGPRPRSWAERAGHPAPRPFRDRDTGRYGFKDAEGRAVIVSAFERVGDFRGGVAVVQRNGLWGAITREGRTVVPFLYDEMRTEMPDGRTVEGFVDGVVGVDRRGGKGAVDRSGRLVVPPHYRQVVCHPGGFAVCASYGQWGAIDRDGQEILPERYRKEQVLSRLESFIVVDNGPL